jgi:four helix bundle protein
VVEKIQHFKELRVRQKGMEVVKDVYRISKRFSKEEIYCLTMQMRRSAISIPSNIAEGFRWLHRNENKQFFSIALSSTADLETQVIIAHELNYIDEKESTNLCDKLDHISRMLNIMIQKLK